jgi:hypothetical protein
LAGDATTRWTHPKHIVDVRTGKTLACQGMEHDELAARHAELVLWAKYWGAWTIDSEGRRDWLFSLERHRWFGGLEEDQRQFLLESLSPWQLGLKD